VTTREQDEGRIRRKGEAGMKAARVQPDGSLVVSDVPEPEPGPGDVVVKVAYCGICGTDIHMLDAGLLPPGLVIGHEISGTVAHAGVEVEGWREGDPVALLPLDPCFSCEPCRQGSVMICREAFSRNYGVGGNPGGFSEFMLVRPSMLFRIPEGLDLRAAALNEPWSVAVHGVNLSGIPKGGPAVVMGAGPIGLLCVAALRAMGAGAICVSEPDPYRREKAEGLGVDLVVDPSRESPGDVVRDKIGRDPETVFECVGTETSIQDASAIVGPFGRVVALGVPMGPASIFPMSWFMKEIRLSFSLGYTYEEFERGLRLLAQGAVDPDTVISDVLPLGEIQQAMGMLRSSGHMKILIDCRSG